MHGSRSQVVVFAGLLLGSATLATAQVRMGVVGDLNFANMSTDDPEFQDAVGTQVRMGVGGVAEFALDEDFSLVVEPMWLGKGSKATVAEGGYSVTGKVKLSYIELPLLAKYAFGKKDGMRGYLLGGPTLGIKTGAKVGVEFQGMSAGSEEDISDEVEATDLGVSLGAGVSAPLGSARAFVEAQYVLGLNDIDKAEDSATKNRGFQIRLGVSVPLGAR